MRDVAVMIWVAIAAIVTTAAIVVVFVTRRNRSETIVLGRQVADARAHEAARLASRSVGPSPMPKGDYDKEGGDYDSAAVTELPLDRELQGLVRAFSAWTPEKRAEVRGHISMDEQYTLVHFGKRCAVLALNEKSMARVEDGLLALAMIDETRIDRRDGAWAVGLLAHAIEATGTDPALAVRLAARLQRGRYIAEPEIATEVPSVWFDKAHRASAEQLLKKARGSVSVNGTLRRAYTDTPFAQQFVQWVVEMPSAEEARTLVEYVGVNTRLGSRFVIGVADGRLFSLLVAGSSMEGVASFETPESLASIATDTRALLQEAAR